MNPETATIRSGIFENFGAFLSRKGVRFDVLLQTAGLDVNDLSDHSASLPLDRVMSLLERAAEQSGDPCLGLHWAEDYPVGATGVFGYALVNSRTVRDAMQTAKRYLGLFLHPADVDFLVEDGFATLSWRLPPDVSAPNTQYTLFSVAATLLRLRAVAGPGWQPFAIDFTFRELPCTSDLHRILGPTIHFNMPSNAIIVDAATLNSSAGSADTRLFELVSELGDRLLSEQSEATDITALTRRAIVTILRTDQISLEAVAESLQLPVRTLQSRLTQAGTSFEAVLQDTRKQMAIRYLRDTDVPLTDIAFMLGFSELSVFTRAAQRWFEMPPSAYRAQSRK